MGFMDTRRLRYLLELSRLGSMRAVADVLGATTSTVSQQISLLAQETGARLLEPHGRGVRLTPAGRRLAEHAAVILSAVDSARADLNPQAEPTGTLRVSGFATAIRRTLMPIIRDLALQHPTLEIVVKEHEPAEAYKQLAADEIDLALTYDYNLAPDNPGPGIETMPLWSIPWGLGVPNADADLVAVKSATDSPAIFAEFSNYNWIGNSRNQADEVVLRTIASMANFQPALRHESDSLELVEDLILAGLGVGLLPMDRPARHGLSILPLNNPGVQLRAFARIRQGRGDWPALAVVLEQLRRGT